MKRPPIRPLVAAAAALLLAACDDHDHDHETEDPTAEACEHAADGPFNAVDAAAADAAPAIQSYSHSRVDIALPADGDDFAGSVAFNVAEAGDFVFFLTADVPLAFEGPAGPIAVEETEAIDACDVVAVAHTVELPAGEVILTFGPTPVEMVGVVFEEAGAHHDHE